jgi:hypothetical protein
VTTKWKYQAEMINACNCDWGCPCNFNAKPTQGFCEGTYGVHITSGFCGDVKLDGLKYAWSGKWPRAVHEGSGTTKIWIDESATAAQRASLEEILKGKLGGMPWMILASTIDHWLETAYVPFEWRFDGPRSSYKGGTEVQTVLDSMRNPVTGVDTSATVLLPTGLVCKELHPTATRIYSVFTKGMKIAAPGKYGFYTVTEHGN